MERRIDRNIIACEIFKDVLDEFNRKYNFNIRYLPLDLHFAPEKLKISLNKIISKTSNQKIYFFYGECSLWRFEKSVNYKFLNCFNCYDYILGREKFKKLMKQNYFITSNCFVNKWNVFYSGNELKNFRDMTRDTCSKIIYYKVPGHKENDKFDEFTKYFGLPYTLCDYDMNYFEKNTVKFLEME